MKQHISEKAKQRNLIILGVTGFGILIFIVIGIIGLYLPGDSKTPGGFLFLLLPITFLINAYFKRCTSCSALWAEIEDTGKTEEVSRKKGYRTRTDTHDIKNSNGDVIGTTKNSYQVRVQTSTHRHYYHCVLCNYVWTKEKQTTNDSFDED